MNRLSLPLAPEPTTANGISLHQFTSAELAECRDGKCCQCGRCCAVFDVYVPPQFGRVKPLPEEVGKPASAMRFKLAGVLCHQAEEKDGRTLCACQGEKGHGAMKACAEWSGKDGGYEDVVDLTRNLFLAPKSLEQIALLESWLQTGRLSDIQPVGSRDELVRFLRHHVRVCRKISPTLFAFAKVTGHVKELNPAEKEKVLLDIGINMRNPSLMEQQLVKEYFNNDMQNRAEINSAEIATITLQEYCLSIDLDPRSVTPDSKLDMDAKIDYTLTGLAWRLHRRLNLEHMGCNEVANRLCAELNLICPAYEQRTVGHLQQAAAMLSRGSLPAAA